jgi:hypothetical protein
MGGSQNMTAFVDIAVVVQLRRKPHLLPPAAKEHKIVEVAQEG